MLFDLYCGAGAIGLILAQDAGQVYGWENVPEAIADAERNASESGITNAQFALGDVLDGLEVLRASAPAPDVIVIDPPRRGLHPKVAPAIAELGPRRIVYVSCNVRATAEDLPHFVAGRVSVDSRPAPRSVSPHAARRVRPDLGAGLSEEGNASVERDESAFPYGGLCARCRHVRVIRSAKGSTFTRCSLASSNPAFPKYPPQPVRVCSGFEA